MRVLICGSRSWADKVRIKKALLVLKEKYGTDITLIVGGARGADAFAEWFGENLGFNVQVFEARWDEHGKAAGPIRNQKMLDKGKPDLVLAFWDGISRGTKHMIDIAKAAGVRVVIVKQEHRKPRNESA